MIAVRTAGEKKFYRRALERLPVEERDRERSRGIPGAFSLYTLAGLFYTTACGQGWISQKSPVVLAVSGGSDSMALLWFFRTFYEGRSVVAHLEHGIRGEESLADARFVEETAGRWGIDAEIRHVDVPGGLKRGESPELGARRVRYDFLKEMAEKHGAFGVALGHNREDVAETVLFNLLRGSGARGAAGIPRRRGIFFRPFLSCSREFLRGVLRCRGIEWREDRTNAENCYTRNFIRNDLMPLIERRINARAAEHLAAFAEEMECYREEEEVRGDALLREAGFDATGSPFVERTKLHNMSERQRALLVRATGRRLGIPVLSRERVMELSRLMDGGARFVFQWGGGTTIFGDRDRLCWTLPADGNAGLKLTEE